MAELNDRELRTIQSAAMFSSLKPEAIRDLAADCMKVEFAPHEPITQPGLEADRFFVILSGHVRLFESAENLPASRTLLGPGQTFGETETMAQQPYRLWAEGVEPTVVLAISRKDFREAMRQNLEFVAGMVAGLAGRVKELAELAQQQALASGAAYLAARLLKGSQEAGSSTFVLNETPEQMGKAFGAGGKMVEQMLDVLAKQNLIQRAGTKITILDQVALEHLAKQG